MDYSAEKYKLKLYINKMSENEKDKIIDELIDNLYHYNPEFVNMDILLSMLKIQTEQTNDIKEQDEIIDKEPYTKIEKEIADNLVKAWNSFCKLEKQHPDETRYFCDGIYKCQSVLGMRILRRDYPNVYPIKKIKSKE